MVVAAREMRRAHDHKPADVAIRGYVADFCETSGAQEAFAFQLRVAHAQTWRGRIWKSRGEAHNHEICGGISGTSVCARNGALCRWRNELK